MATIKANGKFSAESAAKTLNKSLKGVGTNEGNIIEVLTTHNAVQREEIAKTYETSYGRDLINHLRGELCGQFLNSVLALMDTAAVYLARELRSAIKGPGTDENMLIEIICPRTNAEIDAIKDAYSQEFGRSLVEDVSDDTRGDFKHLLVSQLSGNRDESKNVDKSKAEADAKDIVEAGEGQFGTDESVFNQILCTRSFPQLNATFDEYKKISGNDIEETIRRETVGVVQEGYLAVVNYAQDPAGYFADRLYKSLRGAGTDDETLIRVITTRSEIDLANVAQSFEKQYNESLSDFVKSDSRGDYKDLLLAVIG